MLIPAHLEVTGLIRAAEAAGGFGAVLRKGHREAGAILLVLTERGGNARALERMAQLDGRRKWTIVRKQVTEKQHEFSEYLDRRGASDPDLWIVELDVADGERLVGEGHMNG